MKTKPITLILTLLFCLSGSSNGQTTVKDGKRVYSVKEIKKEESDLLMSKYFSVMEGNVWKKTFRYIKSNKVGQALNGRETLTDYILYFNHRKSDDEKHEFVIKSFNTNTDEIFIGKLQCVFLSKWELNDSLAFVKWTAPYFNKAQKIIGSVIIELNKSQNQLSPSTSYKFVDKNQKELARIIFMQSPSYKEPKFQWKKIGNKKTPCIPHPYSAKASPHLFEGSFYKIKK